MAFYQVAQSPQNCHLTAVSNFVFGGRISLCWNVIFLASCATFHSWGSNVQGPFLPAAPSSERYIRTSHSREECSIHGKAFSKPPHTYFPFLYNEQKCCCLLCVAFMYYLLEGHSCMSSPSAQSVSFCQSGSSLKTCFCEWVCGVGRWGAGFGGVEWGETLVQFIFRSENRVIKMCNVIRLFMSLKVMHCFVLFWVFWGDWEDGRVWFAGYFHLLRIYV